MQDQLFYIFSALLAGVVLGAGVMYYLSHSSAKKGKTIEKVEQDLDNYKHDVAIHFETTANLVEDLTQNYKRVFDHLSKGAKTLMSEEELKNQIEKRKGNKVTLEFLNEEVAEVDVEVDVETEIEIEEAEVKEAEIEQKVDDVAVEVVEEVLENKPDNKSNL